MASGSTSQVRRRDFAQVFGAAIREFALSLGKKNCFTFGKGLRRGGADRRFVGRDALEPGDLVGVDAALDPLFFRLPGGGRRVPHAGGRGDHVRPTQGVQQGIVSSHGEASRFFVTFLDNHDQRERLYRNPPDDPHRFDDQVTLAIGCLFTLQGIPCLYRHRTRPGRHRGALCTRRRHRLVAVGGVRLCGQAGMPSTPSTPSHDRSDAWQQSGRASQRCATVANISAPSRATASTSASRRSLAAFWRGRESCRTRRWWWWPTRMPWRVARRRE